MLPTNTVFSHSLTALIITKNEANNITECLQSVGWVSEIVVVDAQSTDQTTDIAKGFTDRVFVRPWPGFGLQKNYGIDQARSEWILIVDADERVSQDLAEEIQELLSLPTATMPEAFRIPRRNYFYGKWIRWGGAYPDYQIRLFRKEKARYNDIVVHENLIVDGKIGTLSRHLDHHTERRITDHFRKFNLYTTLASQEKQKVQRTVSWYHMAVNPLVIFFKTYVLKHGYKDGTRGLIFAVFASMYTFVKYTKVFEHSVQEKQNIAG